LNSNLVNFLFKAKNLSLKRSKTKLEQGLPIPNLNNFKEEENKSLYELVNILTAYLIKKKTKDLIFKINDFLRKTLASKNLVNHKKICNREMIINAIKSNDKKYIQRVIDYLIFQLFDLNENLINDLLSEYYNT
jgi:hypothetical protein